MKAVPAATLALASCLSLLGCGDSASEEVMDGEFQAEASVSGAVDGDELVPVSVVAGISPFYGFGRTMVLSEHSAVRITDSDNT